MVYHASQRFFSFFICAYALIVSAFASNSEEFLRKEYETIISNRKLSSKTSFNDVQNTINDLPHWLQDYIWWHAEQRRSHMDDPGTKFLTVACHRDFPCGGVSDRLRSIPYFLLLAHRTNRVLLIKWQKFELEEYLIPPPGGLDWLKKAKHDSKAVHQDIITDLKAVEYPQKMLLTASRNG